MGIVTSISFEHMISAPLSAATNGQFDATMESVNFIRSVGFEEDNTPKMVDFKYKKQIEAIDEDGRSTFMPVEHLIKIPILNLLSVPNIRIEETIITFHAKIAKLHSTTVPNEITGGERKKVSLQMVYASQNQRAGEKYDNTFDMKVQIFATYDEWPDSIERLFNLPIEEEPVTQQINAQAKIDLIPSTQLLETKL